MNRWVISAEIEIVKKISNVNAVNEKYYCTLEMKNFSHGLISNLTHEPGFISEPGQRQDNSNFLTWNTGSTIQELISVELGLTEVPGGEKNEREKKYLHDN